MIITLSGANFSEDNINGVRYTITFVCKDESGATLTPTSSNKKLYSEGANITFTSSNAPIVNGYTFKSASPASISNLNANTTVTVTYSVSSSGGGDPVTPTTMTLKAYFDSVNASTTIYKIEKGAVSWVGGKNYRHCIIPLSSGISHVKIATGTEASGVAGLLYLSSGAITDSSIIKTVYGTNTTWITHSTFRGLDTDIFAPAGATHIAIGEFINKSEIGCTDDDLILTFGSSGSSGDPNNTTNFMNTIGTTNDTYRYDGSNLTMVGSTTSVEKYRHVIVPVASYNITHLCCMTGSSKNNIGPVLFLSGSELTTANVLDSKFGTITDSSIVLNGSFCLFDEDITIPSGCTHIAWIEYNPINEIIDTTKCNYTVAYN